MFFDSHSNINLLFVVDQGRGQALRRIFQRAIRYAMQHLGAKTGFINRAATSVVMVMGDIFPELKDHEENILNILKQEESIFCKTMVCLILIVKIYVDNNAFHF